MQSALIPSLLNSKRSLIMGVLNTTPDSFSDGGKFRSLDAALRQAEQMIADGVDIIDVGGESTRPGAKPVAVSEELERTIPVLEKLSSRFDCALSIDTSTAEVMEAAFKAGVHLINDVRALQREGALEVATKTGLPVCLMHMQGQPETMQENPDYQDVTQDVIAFLQARIGACVNAGIEQDRLLLDPGFGFGKTLEQNYQLLAQLSQIQSMGYPLLVGMSRKSMIGNVVNQPADKRLGGSIALATLALMKGSSIIRVHDVFETKQASLIVEYFLQQIK